MAVSSVGAVRTAGGDERQVQPRPEAWSLSSAALVSAAVAAASFLALFYPWLHRQHRFSAAALDDWGHTYLIPLISAYLLWQRREALRRARPATFWPALAPFLLGIVAYFFFIVGVPNHMLQGFAMLLTLFGLVLLLAGPAVMTPVFLPLAYLIFGVTISQMIMIKVTFQLQLIASQGSWVVLSLIGSLAGFTVDVAGNTLTIFTSAGEPIPLDVAAACSGMRMVVAFIALAAAVALLSCTYWWQRVLLLLLAVPVAIVLNIARVTALGVASLFDRNLASGEAHTLIGTLLLIPGLLMFMGVVWVLHRAVRDGGGSAGGEVRP